MRADGWRRRLRKAVAHVLQHRPKAADVNRTNDVVSPYRAPPKMSAGEMEPGGSFHVPRFLGSNFSARRRGYSFRNGWKQAAGSIASGRPEFADSALPECLV